MSEQKRSYEREWYKNNPKRKAAVKERSRRQRNQNRISMRDWLDNHPCVDCGYVDWRALEFDHVRGVKRSDVTTMVQNGLSWKTIQEEIDKCDVRCANCHRIRTFVGTYRGALAETD